MRSLFPHRLHSQQLFCRRCRRVTLHGLWAKESYSTYGGLDPHIPLLCICDDCATTFMAFSHEFAIGRHEENSDYTKVYGFNRIIPGNWVYFKGTPKPGKVTSYFQSNDKEVIMVSYDGGPAKKIECDFHPVQDEVAPEGYRLIPAQTANVLMGDHVYHAIRDMFGTAVGLVSDAGKDKLAILLDNQSLLFITIPMAMQNLQNDKLTEFVRNKLTQLFLEDSRCITITVGQGVVYLDGLVKSLAIKRSICACVNSIPRVRGCVDFMRVRMDTYISDEHLENSILRLLETPGFQVFDYSVKVENSKARVNLACVEEFYPRELENRIANLAGLQDMAFSMRSIPESNLENRSLCKEAEHSLAVSPRLADCVIRVFFCDGRYLLEGRVSNAFQRQWAMINTLKVVKTSSIENRLRIS